MLKKKKELRKKKWRDEHWKRKIDLSYVETTTLNNLYTCIISKNCRLKFKCLPELIQHSRFTHNVSLKTTFDCYNTASSVGCGGSGGGGVSGSSNNTCM